MAYSALRGSLAFISRHHLVLLHSNILYFKLLLVNNKDMDVVSMPRDWFPYQWVLCLFGMPSCPVVVILSDLEGI